MAFLAMGGYAGYVWPAYGLAAVLLIGLLWTSLRRLRRNERLLAGIERHRGSRRSPRLDPPRILEPQS